MTLWTNGAGVFHEENSEYPGPLETVRELAYWFTRKFCRGPRRTECFFLIGEPF